MIELLLPSMYLLIGACWCNIAEEFVFTKTGMSTTHKLLSAALWPLDIFMGGVTR